MLPLITKNGSKLSSLEGKLEYIGRADAGCVNQVRELRRHDNSLLALQTATAQEMNTGFTDVAERLVKLQEAMVEVQAQKISSVDRPARRYFSKKSPSKSKKSKKTKKRHHDDKKSLDVSVKTNFSNGGSYFDGGSSQGRSSDEGKENKDSDCRWRSDDVKVSFKARWM